MITLGPVEARIRWELDPEPYDIDEDPEYHADTQRTLELYGVYGCIVETRPPACACCGVAEWHVAESLWSIVGDVDYHAEIERELLAEVAAA